MPIVTIEIVTRPGEQFSPQLAHGLADRLGQIFTSPPGNTWVKVHFIAPENYAENKIASRNVFPVFVAVLKAQLGAPDAQQGEVAQLTTAIARICDRPSENVHIVYLPPGAGRVAFGGQLLSA